MKFALILSERIPFRTLLLFFSFDKFKGYTIVWSSDDKKKTFKKGGDGWGGSKSQQAESVGQLSF